MVCRGFSHLCRFSTLYLASWLCSLFFCIWVWYILPTIRLWPNELVDPFLTVTNNIQTRVIELQEGRTTWSDFERVILAEFATEDLSRMTRYVLMKWIEKKNKKMSASRVFPTRTKCYWRRTKLCTSWKPWTWRIGESWGLFLKMILKQTAS